MNDPIPTISKLFGISAMDAYLLLTTPRFQIGAAGSGTTWTRSEVERDLRLSISEDGSDQAATESLIGRLFGLNPTHLGWFVLGVRSMRPDGEVFSRPD
jgi:hypothetical protein